MRALPKTPELLRVARRVIWFDEPENALADPRQFLAHVMVYGTVEDLVALRGIVGLADFREVIGKRPARHLRRPLLGLLEPRLRPPSGAASAAARRIVSDWAGTI